ncbi:tetratricopeptide repeat protein [Candidatus Electronema sp. TJ]|uniref:tetratricopeptide repeat protein n=1 Tax=Candidatus Electronema sp. TJ TaxID=3401573 RepID=UPI003AA98C82
MKDCTINQHVDGDGKTFSGSGDVQSNSFASHGGPQNVAQGTNPIGCQINNYNSQSPAPPIIPRQIPAPEPCVLYRDEELVWLNERLHPGKVAAVCGPGGMGKSALAAQAVSKLEPARFPDGIIFHSFYHQPKVETALQAICQAFQVEAKVGLESTVRQVLSGRQALLILDGTEQADDLPALLRLRGLCGVLITSRKRTDALADRLDLKPLDEQPAAEVFRLYSGVAADDPSVAGICTLLGGWPVALRIAGRYISSTGESAADYLQWLEQEPFKELAGGEHQEENAALLLRRSVDAVSDDARLVLGVAGCLAFAPLAREPLAAMLEDDARRARAALGELVNYGLLERKAERWQISHALIHAYARTELALSTDALERLAGWYIAFCKAACAEHAKGYARLDSERAHCLRLIESCLASKLWQKVKGLAGAIDIYLERQGYWTEELAAIEMCLTAAQQAEDRKDEGVCLNNLGYTCEKRGEYDKALAYFKQSLPIRREVGDRQGEASTLDGIAIIYRIQRKYDLALQQYQQSLSIEREIDYREGEGATLINIGFLYNAQGDNETALKYYHSALAITKEMGDKWREGITLNNIARIYDAQGNPAKALEYHEQDLAICQQLGDRAGEAVTCGNIGVVCYNLGDLAKAEEHISLAVQIAEQIAEQIGHPSLQQWREGLARVRAARQG